jgi:uncharacterized protein YqjF (DUF2071 family)
MSSVKSGTRILYHSRRKSTGAEDAVFEYETPATSRPAEPGSLDCFLVERYLLFSSNPSGELFCGRVHHTPYQIAPATCTRWSTEPIRLDEFPEPAEAPPSMLVAAPVDVKIFPLRSCPTFGTAGTSKSNAGRARRGG